MSSNLTPRVYSDRNCNDTVWSLNVPLVSFGDGFNSPNALTTDKSTVNAVQRY
jgi:hypothetical protein